MDKAVTIFQGLTNLQKILLSVILGVVLYGISTSLAYSLFAKIGPAPVVKESATAKLPTPSGAFVEDPNESKTESCPLNGTPHTNKAQDFWSKRRPLAVMVENHTEARPQSG